MALRLDSNLPGTFSAEVTPGATRFVHPVEQIQKTSLANQQQLQQFTLNNMFGTHMFLRLQTEQAILSQFQRLPGLQSEFSGLQTMLGQDETIELEDYLGSPMDPVDNVSVHDIMEKRLGVSTLAHRY
ncbi:proteasome maturation factor UMP1 family protein [Planoprotostelium fungivorum]|uniref:Proteasome maturation factor UMP1 family protein n=1 Tax=Planoprotostelium fungivorum TaxID=1890364 RepID=A0A2P6N876_9EUKA|nr:proteasome maturation factor UMP1 family protein [Planoprotostelium fungivorum]